MAIIDIDTLSENNYHIKDKLFKYTLDNAVYGVKILKHAPDGWRQGEVTFERDRQYHGVFRTFSTNEISFVKEGKEFLKKIYNNQGISAECVLSIEILNSETYEYESYFTGRIDFATYKETELMVEVQVIDNSAVEQFKSRDEIELDILDDKNINGFSTYPITQQTLKLKQKKFFTEAQLDNSGTLSVVEVGTFQTYIIPKIGIFENSFNEITAPNLVEWPIDESWSFFSPAEKGYELSITGTITGTITGRGAVPNNQFILILNKNGLPLQTWTNNQYNSSTIIKQWNFSFTFSTTINITEGDYLMFYIFTNTYDIADCEITKCDIHISSYEYFPERQITAIPVYEAFFRLSNKIITGYYNNFHSEFFGRTDTPVTTYHEDGETQFVTRGMLIRGKSSINPTLPISFRDLFTTMSSIWNLGATLQYFSGSGWKVRIEQRTWFYENTVVLDISDRIREAQVEIHVIPEMFYNEIKTGYKSYSYELRGGLKEFNTEANFTTVLDNVKNKLDIISTYRGDTQGIDLIRKTIADKKIDDIKGDEDIFIIDGIKENNPNTGQPEWYARQGKLSDGFDYVTGGLGADESYNLRFTPKRNLLRWYWIVVAGLVRNIGSYIRWQSSSKYTQLESKLTNETAPVKENEHIKVGLQTNRWLNEKLVFEAPLYWNEVKLISNNPRGLIKVGSNLFGWVLKIQTNSTTKMAKFELLKANNKTL